MSQIETKVEGLNDLLRNIDILKDTVLTAQASGMAQVSKDVASYAKSNHPFTNRTGNLEASIQAEPVELDGNIITGVVRAGMEYSKHVEYGTSKSSPYPFMEPAKEANKQNLIDTMKAVTERAQQALKVSK